MLDSARRLARAAYGPTSNAYIEATVNAASAAVHFQPPRVATALARAALNALGPSLDRFPELRVRALLVEATAIVLDARIAEMDVIARDVITMELARTSAPTMARAWAWRLRSLAMTPDSSHAALTLAVAIVDSIGAKRSVERVDMQYARADLAVLDGRIDDATRLADETLAEARAGFGASSREVALLSTIAIDAAIVRKEFAKAAALADALGAVEVSLHDMNGGVLVRLAYARHNAYLAVGDLARAQRVDATLLAKLDRMETPLVTLYALSMAAATHELGGDFAIAERELRDALIVSASRAGLGALAASLRAQLAGVLVRQGRNDDAQAQIDSLPVAMRDNARALLRKQIKPRR